jgi:hypothetical protein
MDSVLSTVTDDSHFAQTLPSSLNVGRSPKNSLHMFLFKYNLSKFLVVFVHPVPDSLFVNTFQDIMCHFWYKLVLQWYFSRKYSGLVHCCLVYILLLCCQWLKVYIQWYSVICCANPESQRNLHS